MSAATKVIDARLEPLRKNLETLIRYAPQMEGLAAQLKKDVAWYELLRAEIEEAEVKDAEEQHERYKSGLRLAGQNDYVDELEREDKGLDP